MPLVLLNVIRRASRGRSGGLQSVLVDPAANVRIQRESSRDRDAIRAVTEAAFGRSAEADLIDRLRVERAVLLSLVALVDQQLIGHVLFSRMHIETEGGLVPAVALAPVAVRPDPTTPTAMTLKMRKCRIIQTYGRYYTDGEIQWPKQLQVGQKAR